MRMETAGSSFKRRKFNSYRNNSQKQDKIINNKKDHKIINKVETNKAFNQLLENPNDKDALALLKEKNKKLYNIALFMKDPTANNDGEFLKELSLYSQAIKEQDIQKLSLVTQSQEFLLKDFALFNKALILVQKEQYAEAKETLKQISEDSNLDVLVKMLEHYLLTK
jgi:FMN phosphatase YigB (HAD superfamily)